MKLYFKKSITIVSVILIIIILTILSKYNINKNINKEHFYSGIYQSKDKLNYTLLETVKILNANKINNWFIAYGTLLGIIRGDSCIDGDDDIDIICNKDDYQRIKDIFTYNLINVKISDLHSKKNRFSTQVPGRFLQIKGNCKYSQVDFYMSDIDKNGNFKDNWEKLLWSNCYVNNNKLIEYKWKNNILYLPNNYKTKLKNIYGDDWKTPRKRGQYDGCKKKL
jgi:phosphorylcholine metabolism protein LicD